MFIKAQAGRRRKEKKVHKLIPLRGNIEFKNQLKIVIFFTSSLTSEKSDWNKRWSAGDDGK